MSYTVVTNDSRATRVTGTARHEMQEAQGNTTGEVKVLFDETGLVYIVGRGESDTNITYTALYNTANVLCYTYPNAAGNGLVTTTVKP